MKWEIYGSVDAPRTAAFNPRTARAFCEGRKANADGGVIGDNPFTTEREKENQTAWATGFNAYTGTPADKLYCAV